MNIYHRGTKVTIDKKYYTIIEYYPDNVVDEIILNFNPLVSSKLMGGYDEDSADPFLIIILECNDSDILNKELNSKSYQDETICLNKEFINK